MIFGDLFAYVYHSTNDNGHITYYNCVFLKEFGKIEDSDESKVVVKWRKGDKLEFIHSYGNIFLYMSSSQNEKGNMCYNDCTLLFDIGDHKKGTTIDAIGGILNLYMWKGDDMVGDETLSI